MQFFLISDNVDTEMGLRLAGIRGVVVHEENEVIKALKDAAADSDVAVILMTEKLVRLCRDMVFDMKLHMKSPLIVEIPDRHATADISSTISGYVQDAIGLKL